MGNILFKDSPQPQGNQVLNTLNQVRQSGPSNIIFNKLYNSNPQFKQFADGVKGKTPDQAFREHGLDFGQFANYRW